MPESQKVLTLWLLDILVSSKLVPKSCEAVVIGSYYVCMCKNSLYVTKLVQKIHFVKCQVPSSLYCEDLYCKCKLTLLWSPLGAIIFLGGGPCLSTQQLHNSFLIHNNHIATLEWKCNTKLFLERWSHYWILLHSFTAFITSCFINCLSFVCLKYTICISSLTSFNTKGYLKYIPGYETIRS